MKVLLFGSRGQVGSVLTEKLKAAGFETLALNSDESDITSSERTLAWCDWQPDLIINATAYTAVDLAEKESDIAYAVNEKGIANLIQLARKSSCPVFNISTDYVFDGSGEKPYQESDNVSPLGVYGESKRAGEVLLERSGLPFINLRTSWVFGESGSNFVKTMLRLAQERDSLGVVSDQVGCPTYAGDIAEALIALATRLKKKEEMSWGHFHFSGDESVSWYEFSKCIFAEALEAQLIARVPEVKPITSEEYPTPAKRPKYSVLDCGAIFRCYGILPSDWKKGLRQVVSSTASGD